jgi:glucokinase
LSFISFSLKRLLFPLTESIFYKNKKSGVDMKDNLSLGIDLGGTKIYAIVVDKDYKVLASSKSRTEPGADPARLAEQIKETGENALKEFNASLDDIGSIGIAIPSSIDPDSGDCLHATNLGWKNFSIKHYLEDFFRKDIFLGNDGNCGILGEYYCGAAKGFDSVVGFFIGTGLGGGIIIDGKLCQGNAGLAGELGHMIIKYGGRKCNCGNKGCIEAYASKVGFVKGLKKELFKKRKRAYCSIPDDKLNWKTTNLKSSVLAKAYRESDHLVCGVLDKGMTMLGAAAASVTVTVSPQCLVLGGGVMESLGPELLPVFQKGFEDNIFGIDPARITIRMAELADDAVATGATVLARKRGNV